ncbi:F-box protein CPR1-like [Silene latifolia]|uniref:F-box protein CPR1-like n=1 Tax=Silene latifolia TaxID=37657 RepID=UPI003D776085
MAAVRNPSAKRTMLSIPTEIITDEILPKLPVKSLARFKCVSKSFHTLISSHEFINIHLQQSLSSSTNRLLILTGKGGSDLYSFDIDSPDFDTTVINIPLPHTLDYWLDNGVVSIVGSVNGLLCVGILRYIDGPDEFKQVVINPSTRVFREVPYIDIPILGNAIRVSFGFGYDDINDDYKVVRVVENAIQYDPYQGDELYNREVMVYSLNNNTWKLVEDVHRPIYSLQVCHNGVLMKNHLLHWIFWCLDMYYIYCFDVRSDKWVDEVPLMDLFTDPMADFIEDNEHERVHVVNLGVLDGCLCITVTRAMSNLSDVVWMMKEYGVKESWIKLFEISRCSPCCCKPCCYYFDGPYGFRRGSKQEVLVRRPPKIAGLFWFNIGSEGYGKTEEISGIPVFDQACFFTSSLVPIPGSLPIISPAD